MSSFPPVSADRPVRARATVARLRGCGRGYRERALDQAAQLLAGPASPQPVDHVAFGRQAGQLDDPDRGRHRLEDRGDLADVLAAGVVMVRQQDDVPVLEIDREALGELAGAARIAGGEEAEIEQRIHLALALGDQDRPVLVHPFVQAIRDDTGRPACSPCLRCSSRSPGRIAPGGSSWASPRSRGAPRGRPARRLDRDRSTSR